jgi:hypothetical protein
VSWCGCCHQGPAGSLLRVFWDYLLSRPLNPTHQLNEKDVLQWLQSRPPRARAFRFNSQPLVHPRPGRLNLLPPSSAVRVDGPTRRPRHDGLAERVTNGLPTNTLRTPYAPPGPPTGYSRFLLYPPKQLLAHLIWKALPGAKQGGSANQKA